MIISIKLRRGIFLMLCTELTLYSCSGMWQAHFPTPSTHSLHGAPHELARVRRVRPQRPRTVAQLQAASVAAKAARLVAPPGRRALGGGLARHAAKNDTHSATDCRRRDDGFFGSFQKLTSVLGGLAFWGCLVGLHNVLADSFRYEQTTPCAGLQNRGPSPITLWVTPLGEMHAIPLPPKNTKGSYMTIRVRGESGKLQAPKTQNPMKPQAPVNHSLFRWSADWRRWDSRSGSFEAWDLSIHFPVFSPRHSCGYFQRNYRRTPKSLGALGALVVPCLHV